MRFDPLDVDPLTAYKVMTGLIVPRPIAWVSTVDPEGVHNLAPFSFFNGVAARPATLSISVLHEPKGDHRKDTWRNIEATKEFVVNVVSGTLMHQMNETSARVGPEIDEFELTGLTPAPSEVVSAPRVAEALVNLECRLYDAVRVGEGMGGSTLIVGEIVLMHVADEVIDAEHLYVDVEVLDPVARLPGVQYTRLGDVFEMPARHHIPERPPQTPTSEAPS